jgi:hypothetical protein
MGYGHRDDLQTVLYHIIATIIQAWISTLKICIVLKNCVYFRKVLGWLGIMTCKLMILQRA